MDNASASGRHYGFSEEELLAQSTVFAKDLFAGKSVLISGAGSGIGKAAACLYARLGAKLVLCGRDQGKLDATAAWLARLGAQATVIPMTIRDPEQVEMLMDRVWSECGGIDVLVNNAGGQFPQPAIDFSVKGWNAVIDTNLNGTWYMMQAAAKRWRDHQRTGCIVNIVLDFWRGMGDMAHSCAARAGVTYLSRCLAVEWAPYGIRVNCIAPGVIETSALDNYPPDVYKNFERCNPMKRPGDAHDIAEACIYLSASSGKFINGECLTIDGGQQLWGEVWVKEKPEYFKVGNE